VVLTHGGPRAGDLCHERPVSAAAVLDPPTGRTPVALDEEGWTRVLHLFRQEAGAAARAGAWAVGVEAARGHLWHAAISPLLCGDEALSRRGQDRLVSLVADLARVHPRVLVSLAVEDGAPGGLYPALGVSVARRVCEAGAGLVVARTGSPYAHPRLAAADPRSPEEEGGALHAARWLRRALPSTCLVAVADGIRSLAVAQSAVAQACCDVVVASEPLVGSGPDP
jgi:2,4-dienoyl-CoA reductase-like NADH-dependent reductase (Old Yellow Enzyme family)